MVVLGILLLYVLVLLLLSTTLIIAIGNTRVVGHSNAFLVFGNLDLDIGYNYILWVSHASYIVHPIVSCVTSLVIHHNRRVHISVFAAAAAHSVVLYYTNP